MGFFDNVIDCINKCKKYNYKSRNKIDMNKKSFIFKKSFLHKVINSDIIFTNRLKNVIIY